MWPFKQAKEAEKSFSTTKTKKLNRKNINAEMIYSELK